MQATAEKEKKKPGPTPKGFGQYTVSLPPELGEWGKGRPEGLSAMVRRLLAEEKAKYQTSSSEA